MAAKVSGKASWIIEDDLKKSNKQGEHYKPILLELSKKVGAACNTGDIQGYQFLLHYAQLIFQCGFEVLKETLDEVEKSKDFEDFTKKMGILDN